MERIPVEHPLGDDALRLFASAYGTPLYLYDARSVVDRVRRLREVLPSGIELCYAMKANTFLLPEVASLVNRVEVCSPGELRICRALDIPTGQIVVSGVYKDDQTVDEALAHRALPAAVTVESAAQLDLVARAAAARGVRVPVLLRVTSGNQFGLDPDELPGIIRGLGEAPHLELRGLQFFSGTQKTSLKRIAREVARLDELIARLEEATGQAIAELEYGPGLPVSYFAGDDFDEDAYLAAFSGMLAGMAFGGRITLELGRSLVASSGTYLTSVVDTKVNRGQRYAIVDGGMHQLVYYGQSMAMRQPHVRVLGREGAPGAASQEGEGADACRWTVCGALCTVNDLIVKQAPLGALEPGDMLAFANVGAYSATEGIALFLSRDLPRVVRIGFDGTAELVRDGLGTDVLNTPRFSLP